MADNRAISRSSLITVPGTPLLAQDAVDDFPRKRGGKTAVVESGIIRMATIMESSSGPGLKRLPLDLLQLAAAPLHDGQLVMRVDRSAGVTGKCLPQLSTPCSRIVRLKRLRSESQPRRPGPGPVFQRVVEIALIRDIHHRREIQVEAEEKKNLARERAVALDQAQVSLFAKLPALGGSEPHSLSRETRPPPGRWSQWVHVSPRAQIVDQLTQLAGALMLRQRE